MKTIIKLICPLMLAGIACSLKAQNIFPSNGAAGIGTTTPNASSLLEIKSTTKGLLIPRMTKAQRDAIASPATGLMIYQTTNPAGFYYFNGTAWTAVTPKGNGWSLTGNAGTVTGTNFIGTTDAQPLMFKANNNQAGYIDFDSLKANTAFGYQALNSNTTGTYNTASGYRSLSHNTVGFDNSSNGAWALYSNTTGNSNTANGIQTLYYNTSGSDNTANGFNSLLSNTIGSSNTANGFNALVSNTTGNSNTADGEQALYFNTTGSYNTAIGQDALFSNTTGTYNTALGYVADVLSGNLTNATAIGNYVFVDASNKVRVGNTAVTSIGGQVGWTTFSDGRYKTNIKEDVKGLAFINSLRPITYTVDINGLNAYYDKGKKHDSAYEKMKAAMQSSTNEASKIVYNGFVAQEVEAAAHKLNYNFSGVDKPQSKDGLYGLRYSDFVVPLVKAVQELSARNDSLQKQNDAQQKINDEQQKTNDNLQKQIDALKTIVISNQKNNTAVANQQKQSVQLTGASLEQNKPNPFSGTTTIHYTVPSKFTAAQIIITGRDGKSLKQINIQGAGEGSINVDASTLSAGAYHYSLYVDGKLIASKQMELLK